MISTIDAYNIAQGTYPEELRHNQDSGRNENDILHNRRRNQRSC